MATKKNRTREVCTALHILKGAIVKVLHTPVTTSVTFDAANRGRLAVEYTQAEPPHNDQVARIEELANGKIKENVEIETFKIDRKEAEEKYQKEKVNETYIYDKFPVPTTLTELSLLLIKDWNINCCPAEHCKKTGEIAPLKILRTNFRAPKKELEFVFELGGTSNDGEKKKGKGKSKNESHEKSESNTATTQQKGESAVIAGAAEPKVEQALKEETVFFSIPTRPPHPSSDVFRVSDTILNDVFATLLKELDPAAAKAVQEKEQKLRAQLQVEILPSLESLRNLSYTSGFTAHLSK